MLGSILREFDRACSEQGVRLVRDLDETVPSIWADPESLQHLAEILLRNALQATPAGGKIHIRSIRQGEELIWSITDTGKGILPGEATHLFDPFFCGRQAGRGLGLGLHIARTIVEGLGGTISVDSHLGAGATFTVELPVSGSA